MNLGEQLAKILLEQDKQTIALFPGAFKPPHKGHVDVVKKLLDKADQVVVLVSPKMRDGVSAEESVAVWNLYKKLFLKVLSKYMVLVLYINYKKNIKFINWLIEFYMNKYYLVSDYYLPMFNDNNIDLLLIF